VTVAGHDLLILDTNVLIHVIRDNRMGNRIQEELDLRGREERPLISIVTVGEALALAHRFAWGDQKVVRLHELLRNLVVVDISQPGIAERYAELTVYARAAGRTLGDNDRWIAATASITGAELITTDRDFEILDPNFMTHRYFDPGT
jgi:tRNA(fMet)-specific endonuclease VapC